MANTIFTCTPMLRSEKTGFIQRVASTDNPAFDGFRYEDMEKVKKSIIERVREFYEIDAECDQKFAKGKFGIDMRMRDVERLMGFEVKRDVTIAERGQKIFGKDNNHALSTDLAAGTHTRRVRNAMNVKEFLNGSFSGILDANGKYYLTTWAATFPTEIRLNFENKDKLTAPIRPFLKEDTPVKRTLINTME